MSRPVRAKPFVTQMRRGRLPARSCGHDRTIVDRPDRPSGRNASPSGITPSTIMSPARSRHGSWTEIRLGARAHPTRTSNRAHAPPSPSGSNRRSRTDSTCDQVPAQIRSVAAPPASRVRRGSTQSRWRWTRVMIVLGADTHKRSHTIAAVVSDDRRAGGRADGPGRRPGVRGVAGWARGLGGERVWAIEDCRHVSGALERFLIARGERVLRVTTRLMASVAALGARARQVRQHRRDRGRAGGAARRLGGVADGGSWPARSSTCGCWSITASGSSVSASRSTTRCSGTCTISGPSSSCPAARCSTASGAPRIAPAPRARRADDARPHRPRRAAPPARADRRRSTRSRARSPSSSPRSRRSCSPSPASGR